MTPDKIEELEQKITELKARWPPHSVPPHMWLELEALEDELQAAKKADKVHEFKSGD